MSHPIIEVRGLSKQYHIGMKERLNRTFREAVVDALTAPVRNFRELGRLTRIEEERGDTIWALRDVAFEVQPGEVMGIIGRNGAGKSTLLKILSRITEPSSGDILLHGRVASLLEVGTGFHPELTGRENIYLNGTILGMRKHEIDRKFDEIVAFSEIEKFLDTPVKRYSSGMYVRLAFAVASHLEPEILLVDEVLAVGDAEFQKKCLGKMGDVAREGRTVIFVSHNMAAIENLCTRGMVLHQGCVDFLGSQQEAITRYLSINNASSLLLKDRTDKIGNGKIRVTQIEVRDAEGNRIDSCTSGQNISIRLYYQTMENAQFSHVLASISFKTQLGVPVFLHHNRLTREDFGPVQGVGCFTCTISRLPLPAGVYTIGYSIMPDNGRSGTYYDSLPYAMTLTVVEGDFYGTSEIPPLSHGVCLVEASWENEL